MKYSKRKLKTRIRKARANLVAINWGHWFHIGVTVGITLLGYFNIKQEDITTWPILWHYIGEAIKNPYCILLIFIAVFNLYKSTKKEDDFNGDN